jgi:hypothetical protein
MSSWQRCAAAFSARRSVPLVHDLEHRNRALVEAIPDPMIRVACDGTYLDVRADDPSQLVRPPAELIGRN